MCGDRCSVSTENTFETTCTHPAGSIHVDKSLPGSLILGVAVFNIIILGIIAIVKKATTYQIQSYRILQRSGILFKKQISVIFDKIDFINFSQGFLNKMCGNGNITINTAGSSKPEITIRDIKNFRHFYETLQQKYK